jgi:hypothetical protein
MLIEIVRIAGPYSTGEHAQWPYKGREKAERTLKAGFSKLR